jgi:LysR family transcriptional regulator, glycine cleavage system transcriptional activator
LIFNPEVRGLGLGNLKLRRLRSFHLNALHAVEVVARRGSLNAAAEELGVSPSAISQQIGRAEEQIGRALFERSRPGLRPTEFGAVFARRLSIGFNELEQAVALADESATRTLVTTVGPAFATRWLVPRLSRLYERHPEIILRIDASPRIVDFSRSDADLAVRLGRGDWPGAKAQLLMQQEIFLVCAPSIGKKIKRVDDLADQWGIHDENSEARWARWFEAIGHPPVAMRPGARFTDPILSLEAAIAGQGVMLAWPLLVSDALADGRLVAPLGLKGWSGVGYYVVTDATRRTSPKVDAFKRWLLEETCGEGDQAGDRY